MADPLLDLIAGAKREREKPPAPADDGFDFLGAAAGLVAKASRKLKGDKKPADPISTGGIRG